MKKIVLQFCFFAFFSGVIAQNDNQNKSQDNTESIESLTEILQDADLGKALQDLGKLSESMNAVDLNSFDMSSLQAVYQQAGLSTEETAAMQQLLQMAQKKAQAGGGLNEFNRAITTNGQLQRKGDFLNQISDEEFEMLKKMTALNFAYQQDPNSTESSRKAAVDQFLAGSDAHPSQNQKDLFYKFMEANRSGKTIDANEIKVETEEGETVGLGDFLGHTATQTAKDAENVFSEMRNVYKNMSYTEFREQMMSNPAIQQQVGSEAKIKELYDAIQANGGDLFKAVEDCSKRHK